MQKGVSIFYEFHDQGFPHTIAGIYSPYMKTEEEMRTELLGLIGKDSFNERDIPIFVNHTHVYAKFLLDQEMDKKLKYTFEKFFPRALKPDTLPVSSMKFYYQDEGTNKFIWHNRYDEQISAHLKVIQKDASVAYEKKRLIQNPLTGK